MALHKAIISAGGNPAYDIALSNVIVAAVNWRHGPNLSERNHFTELERSLIGAIDNLLGVS